MSIFRSDMYAHCNGVVKVLYTPARIRALSFCISTTSFFVSAFSNLLVNITGLDNDRDTFDLRSTALPLLKFPFFVSFASASEHAALSCIPSPSRGDVGGVLEDRRLGVSMGYGCLGDVSSESDVLEPSTTLLGKSAAGLLLSIKARLTVGRGEFDVGSDSREDKEPSNILFPSIRSSDAILPEISSTIVGRDKE